MAEASGDRSDVLDWPRDPPCASTVASAAATTTVARFRELMVPCLPCVARVPDVTIETFCAGWCHSDRELPRVPTTMAA